MQGGSVRADRSWWCGGLWTLWIVGALSPAHAQPLDPNAIPPELKPWVSWVKDRNPERECVQAVEGTRCLWPSELNLQLNEQGGTFRLRVHADAQQLAELPGEIRRWPQNVRVDNQPVAVTERSGRPVIVLQRGGHMIDGAFVWSALPETLNVPSATALVALAVNGKAINQPRRDEAGQLWLSGGASAEREGEHLEIDVFRHIQDSVPLIVTTRVVIKASGRARETVLDHVLVPGTLAYAIEADLPARLDNDGKLSLQARAGAFQVTITARTEGSPDRLALARASSPWPEQETWVFQADESLRQVRLGGAPSVDPAQTNLPPDWQHLPTFLLRADTALTFETTRRGQPEPPPNQLTLRREMWLDLDGTGYTVRDRLEGELHAGWRLSLPAGDLGHVQGSDGDQLITQLDKHSGVEVRHSHLALTAEWRNEQAQRQVPAVGWSEDVQSLSARLHLPPGWDVFTVQGVDHVSNTWLQGWDLFRFFFVLIVALAAGRMFGAATGAVALVTLVLCHQQEDAPEAVWLVLLTVLGLLRVIPEGQWRTVMRGVLGATLISFAIVAAPFAITQIRHAIYPQIAYYPVHYDEEGAMGGITRMMMEEPASELLDTVQATAAPAAPPPAPEEAQALGMDGADKAVEQSVSRGALRSTSEGGGGKRRADLGYGAPRKQLQDRDPNAVVQTGPGVPSRAFRTWELTWTGPVERGATIELWLIPPLLNSALAFLRVLLIGLLAFLLVRRAPFKAQPRGSSSTLGATVGAATALCLALISPAIVHADTPPPEILAELEARLYPPPICETCLSVTQLDLQAKGNELRMTIEAHAAAPTLVRLPGPAQTWVPSQVSIDGRPDAALALSESGYLQLRLATGTHRIELRGPLSSADSITLSLGDSPRRVTANADGWEISGLHEDGSAEDSVQLSRAMAPDPSAETQAQANTLPPWLEVTRELELGVAWHVTTRVRRVSPTGSAVLVRIPLLAGEAVTAADLQVEDNQALVTLGRDATEASWTSTLAQAPELTLTAPSGKSWSEQWLVQCGRVFHCTIDGAAPIRHTADGQWWPAFRPWPGEHVTLKTTRPLGAKGQSTTIDRVSLDVAPGVRMRRSTLEITVRSSTGGVRTLSLPKAARIQNVMIDDQRAPIRFHEGQLTIGITRGEHRVKVEWQEPGAMEVADSTPAIALGGPATNVVLSFSVPDERWLLFVSGPSWGPAILFWGYLVAMLLLSLVLARIPHSPLRAYQWMLLTIGLTQIETIAQLVIAGWFFALAYRAQRPLQGSFFHNAWQLVLVGWTFVAFGCLYWALHSGLLFPPDMQVHSGVSGTAELSWYVDRVSGRLPSAQVISVSIWVWRCLMLAWALWLAWSLLQWLPWAWRSFTTGGGWKTMARPAPVATTTAPGATPTAPSPEPPVPPTSSNEQ